MTIVYLVARLDGNRMSLRTLLIPLLLIGCGGGRPSGLPPPVVGPDGRAAETVDLALPTLDGRTIRLADYRPRIVLVNYFATWAPASLDDLPALSALDDELVDLQVVAVNLDLKPEDLLPAFFEVLPVSFPVVIADAATRQGLTPFGKVTAIPVSYLLDGSGRFVEMFHGVAPVDHIRRRVSELALEAR
jgi:thiol-disulfide isomerase/thioredoxin